MTRTPDLAKATVYSLIYSLRIATLWTKLSGLDNGRHVTLKLKALDQRKLTDKLELVFSMFPVLKSFMIRIAGTLSGGERRMLAIGMGLMREPQGNALG